MLSCNEWSYLAPCCPSKRQILAISWSEKGSGLPTGRGLGRDAWAGHATKRHTGAPRGWSHSNVKPGCRRLSEVPRRAFPSAIIVLSVLLKTDPGQQQARGDKEGFQRDRAFRRGGLYAISITPLRRRLDPICGSGSKHPANRRLHGCCRDAGQQAWPRQSTRRRSLSRSEYSRTRRNADAQ